MDDDRAYLADLANDHGAAAAGREGGAPHPSWSGPADPARADLGTVYGVRSFGGDDAGYSRENRLPANARSNPSRFSALTPGAGRDTLLRHPGGYAVGVLLFSLIASLGLLLLLFGPLFAYFGVRALLIVGWRAARTWFIWAVVYLAIGGSFLSYFLSHGFPK